MSTQHLTADESSEDFILPYPDSVQGLRVTANHAIAPYFLHSNRATIAVERTSWRHLLWPTVASSLRCPLETAENVLKAFLMLLSAVFQILSGSV